MNEVTYHYIIIRTDGAGVPMPENATKEEAVAKLKLERQTNPRAKLYFKKDEKSGAIEMDC